MQNFIDSVCITVQSGNGGHGAVSFRREKYIPKGGPDGGNGGCGGSVIVKASVHERTLKRLRYKSLYNAENGHAGKSQNKHGKNGVDMILHVPVGTVVKRKSDKKIIGQLYAPEDSLMLLHGGIGGKGNTEFKSSVNRTPYYAQKGKEGISEDFLFELELYADASFIGMPNAGKSTLLKALTNANPKIGNYPFTTLIPNIGTLNMHYTDIILSDIPGILEGASHGFGLGLHFLRHVKRSKVIVYVVDSAVETPECMVNQYMTLRKELENYTSGYTEDEDFQLSKKNSFVVISKIDNSRYMHNETSCVQDFLHTLYKADQNQKKVTEKDIICVSSHALYGLEKLKEYLFTILQR